MTSASSRKSFYPLPPSTYPRPILNPCPAFETTYGHEHCMHPQTVEGQTFYRSRTLHPAVQPASTLAGYTVAAASRSRAMAAGATIAELNRSTGSLRALDGYAMYQPKMYRTDSKGFRKPYHQPAHADLAYLDKAEARRSQIVEGAGYASGEIPRSVSGGMAPVGGVRAVGNAHRLGLTYGRWSHPSSASLSTLAPGSTTSASYASYSNGDASATLTPHYTASLPPLSRPTGAAGDYAQYVSSVPPVDQPSGSYSYAPAPATAEPYGEQPQPQYQ